MNDVILRLSAAEHEVLTRESAALRLKPEELVWCGLDSVMNSIDQPTSALGFLHESIQRFDHGGLPAWAGIEGGQSC